MNGDNARSEVAEDVAAIATLQIAENLLVDHIADLAAGYRSGCTTKQATEDRSRETAEQHSCRTTDGTDGCAGLRTGQSTAGTGCGTSNCADRAADPSGGMQAMDVGRMADGTFVAHGFFSWK